MTIHTVLFDLDGTLIDSLPLIQKTYQKVFDLMQIPWGNAEVMTLIGLPLKEIAVQFAGEDRWEDFLKRYQYHYALEHDEMTRMYPGTLEMLEVLKDKGCSMGIVTSKSRAGALRSTSYLGLDRYMEVIITAEDVTRHKPQPDPVLKALEEMKAQAQTTAYVGDSPFDILAAKQAEVVSIGVTWGMAEGKQLARHEPDHLLEGWEDLFGLI
ncbi:HAD family hydrolase [Desulforamulus ruminis]|uniref:HAD-superfamily hydrolase, subfamily IA, variant 3 n=1 Tax=Desulforamulus ruminis (strain ATCC 23193 / DSM 2154 / NCIMB 8452 / DL) TaxID=696281 RepID=F6DN15_DESRL|nr:HAD-IA family hydrolase [Desulforamulus ruminis]AEG59473.1 HAD-superfamily hydrolase, subfamily IA, variant 3 [Desulforamulus ruminis DSM 2154]